MEHSPGFLALVADAKTRVRETTPEEVHRRQQAGSRFHFVDVREDGEWEKGHARGAVHLSKGIIERDIDLLFVGNLHPAVQSERLPWLRRLARFSDHYRVVIRQGVFGTDYKDLLARARVVYNRTMHGESNLRVFEAAAAGALLFQEEENREVGRYFRDGLECILYNQTNLDERLNLPLDFGAC